MATLPIHEMFLEEGGDVVEVDVEKLTERQENILKVIGASVVEGVVETAGSLAKKLGVSSRTIQRELKLLQEMNRLRRNGGDSNGEWEVVD